MLSKSIINAIIDHAALGNQVAVIIKHVRPVIDQIYNEVHADAIARISRANGNESIEFINGARITFHRTPGWMRGRTASLVVAPMNLSEDDRLNIIPLIKDDGEIIGYM